jgi:aspartyl-tRNA(Asn)/glutamyl-tRNA(Gln) amidotransferase subunit A
LRIGVPTNYYNLHLHPAVEEAWRRMLKDAEDLGAIPVSVKVPDPEGLVAVARAILLAEAPAALAPYLHRRDEFGPDVLALMDQGRQLPGYAYVNAQRVRHAMVAEYRAMFKDIDVLVTPTTPAPAARIGQSKVELGGREFDTRLLATSLVRGINALGLPAISIPGGTDASGLPVGIQLVGRPWAERKLVEVATALMSGVEAGSPATTA